MRSLKMVRVLGISPIYGKPIYGKWYKVFIRDGSRNFWLVRYYGIEDNWFLHKETAYTVYSMSDIREYESLNGIYHRLCKVEDITSIERVNLGYVRGFGIKC